MLPRKLAIKCVDFSCQMLKLNFEWISLILTRTSRVIAIFPIIETVTELTIIVAVDLTNIVDAVGIEVEVDIAVVNRVLTTDEEVDINHQVDSTHRDEVRNTV